MIIADTSVWIEFFRANSDYIDLMSAIIEERKIFAVECIFGELLQGVRSKRESQFVTEYWNHLPKVNEQGIWIEAGMLSFEEKWHSKGVGLIDLAIIVAAKRNRFKIWTLDKKLKKALSPQEIFQV